MTGNEIRKKFLQYFVDRGHTMVDSSALVPQDDPTLLFTNAGMVQFKKVFTGEEKRGYVRAATSQRCVRAGGKHNDLENVGYTARHHTFFEMLGNFSFGDYFKEDAIRYAWEFLTDVIGLPKDKLWVSVFEEDDEAFSLWEKIEGLPAGRIIRLGEKDNFWSMGDTGPCGPCSEILIDQGPSVGCGTKECKAGCDCDRYLELWNLVFMQFYRDESGKMTPLPKPSIDTGMGLERIAAVVQGKQTNYDSDLFSSIIDNIATAARTSYGKNDKTDTALRVIADHSRATAFLVADGVLPANEGRGYVLRRIMRRAIRYGRSLGFTRPFMAGITVAVIEQMKGAYPHLRDAQALLAKVVINEEERFLETLDNGLAMLNDEIKRNVSAASKQIGGDFIFKLYDTFGFPVDIVRDVALEEGLSIDEAGFNAAMAVQREQSKKAWKGGDCTGVSGLEKLAGLGLGTVFTGYETRRAHSVISAIADEQGNLLDTAEKGQQVFIVCVKSPFYAEAGGQVGDHGEIVSTGGRAEVSRTISTSEGLIVHVAHINEGFLRKDSEVEMKVAEGRRQRIANNHTATHLLHAALQQILGDHVKQSGSLVEPDRLRFDFTHFQPMTPDEIKQAEEIVNDEIRANSGMITDMLSREEAMQSGATALFGEKYGDSVRVVSIGDFSKELCGGTHVGATGEIGVCKILSETGVAAGVRRIEAVTGNDAFRKFQAAEDTIKEMADLLKTSPVELVSKFEKLIASQKKLEKEISKLTAKLTLTDLDSIINSAKEVDGVRVIAVQIQLDSAKTLREIGDRVRDKMGSGVAVLGGVLGDKISLLAIVTKDLTKKLHAGDIVKEIAAKVGGSGGGRPDMAQAGGTLPDKLPEALDSVFGIIHEHLSQGLTS
jgi:alanyl-tRNA synthetase